MYEVLKNPDRPIDEHDERDIMFLSTAIPYFDIVITEKTWKHAAKSLKLDIKYKTKVEHDLNFLMTI